MAERTRHREAFNRYWSLGPGRSIDALHAELQRNFRQHGFRRPPHIRTLFEWSARYHWQARIAQLEAEAHEADRAAQLEAIHEMNERQAREGLALQEKALRRLTQLAPEELSADALIRAFLAGPKLERLARGEATDRTELEGELRNGIDLSGFTDDELRRLACAAAQNAAGAGAEDPE